MDNTFQQGVLIDEKILSGRLSSFGEGVKIYQGCRIINPDRMSIGDYSQIDEGVFIHAGAGVSIGRHVHLAFYSSISGGGRCEIGDFASIGAGARLLTGTDEVRAGKLTNPTVPPEYRSVHRGRVAIRKHAVVFTHSIVFPDVTIGEGAVVSAGSVVHRDLDPWFIYGGNPLVKIGQRDPESIREWERKLYDEFVARQGGKMKTGDSECGL